VFAPRSSDGRKRQLLALTAVLAVGTPGCLLTGCTGQQTTAAGGGPSSMAPVARTPDGAKAREATTRKRSNPLALNLMTEAAQAAVVTSYQGEEFDYRSDTGGTTVLESTICHVSGGQTLTQTQASGVGASIQSYMSADPDGQSPEGVLGVTTTLIRLLEDHYVVGYAGSASADNRAAQVVEAWRGDGSLAARFWLDTATKLPLEREVFDPAARVINEGHFINVQIGRSGATTSCATFAPARAATQPAIQRASQPAAQPAIQRASQPAAQPADTWAFSIPPAKLLVLGRQGWRVPPALPGGLILFTGAQITTRSGQILDLAYSDGLYVVSLFEQHGKLAAKLTGWQKVTVGGRTVYAAMPAQRSLTWAGKGTVYTLIADAPPQTLTAAVRALPYDGPPGFWKRMTRGFSRLVSMVNPFR
jgi:sigma-E factor negative regulatory protein RseB